MGNFSRNNHLSQLVVYLCGFLLLWEWLRPLSVVTDTESSSVFVIYTAFCFLISVLNVKWWLSVPLKFAGLIFVLDKLFLLETIFTREWFYFFYMHTWFNIEVIANQQWVDMTPVFRSFLFLVLLWLMSYLLFYWFIIAKRVFLFILLTFIYLTVLDTFTTYQASAAIVRAFVVSLIVLGINNITKEMSKEAISFHGFKKIAAWILPLAAVILFSTIVGFAAPKFDPKWPDPVPYLTSTAENAGSRSVENNGLQKVGYGEDDSQLGGSFVQDTTPVFKALAKEKHYWRIETKGLYTGKGWERLEEVDYIHQPENAQVALSTFTDSVETEKMTASIRFEPNAFFSKLVYPYGINRIDGNPAVNYLLDQMSGAILVEGPEQHEVTGAYQVTYEKPSFSIDVLMKADSEDPEDIREKYLQLPNTLPKRVGNLAAQITSEEETRYEKVKTVEQYFNRNGFIYQTTDVPVPRENQDYVDQFLFETQTGYCDNFSTSMVVLLRTLDIPARWVKGFTGGEELRMQEGIPSGMKLYQVTNSNAHSWVEVYFPEVGWVPFEPTQGFSNPAEFFQEEEQEQVTTTEVEEPQSPEEASEKTEEEMAAAAESHGNDGNALGVFWKVIVVTVSLIAGALILFLTRFKWMSKILLKRYRSSDSPETYQDAYHYLLKLLNHKGMKRKEGMTLREYARYVDQELQTTDMSMLTNYYERILYRNETDSGYWASLINVWEKLVNRALS